MFGAGPAWLAPATVVGASAVGASLWVASVLQVTSDCSPMINALWVAMGIVGGAAAGASRLGARWMRFVFIGVGLTVVAAAGLVAAPLCCH
jgi:hypothetical protein